MAPAECILPDDDENFLDNDDDAVYLINEPSPPASKKCPTQQRISKIFDNMWDSKNSSQNTEVASDTPSISTPLTPPVTRISLENKANTPNNEDSIIIPDVYLDSDPMDNINEQVPIKDTTVTNTTVGPHTICLDSDDEEDTPVRHKTATDTVTNPATNIQITQPTVSVTTVASNVVPLQSPSAFKTPLSGTPEVPNFAPDNRIMILLDELQHPLQIHNYPNVGTSNSAASKVETIKDINLTLKTPVENNKVANTPTSTVKRICKPGDIIRMNSCSKNVILNKKSYTVSKANLSTASKTNSVIMTTNKTASDNMRNLVGKVIASKSDNKNTSKGYVVTLSGSAKDLKIVRTGEKSSISLDLTGASSSRSNDFRATVDTKASDTKKRQKTTVTSEIAKKIKQKSFKIPTLEDFDIEDDDDIVDLS